MFNNEKIFKRRLSNARCKSFWNRTTLASLTSKEEKVLAICKEIGASHYINAAGGRSLYNETSFLEEGIRLSFIQSKDIIYPQFKEKFTSNLSIIDVMMFNHPIQCMKLLDEYEIS